MALARPVSGQAKARSPEVCFDLPQAQKLTLDAEMLPVVQSEVEHYKALVAIRESQVKTLEGANAATADAAAKAVKSAQEARESAPDPLRWFLVGGAAGGVIGAIVAGIVIGAIK